MSESNGEIRHPKKRAFLAAYAGLGVVSKAANVAGINRSTHQGWMRDVGDEGDKYRAAFEDAHDEACGVLELEARRRAVIGVEKPVHYQGERVDTVREYSDTLLIFMLKGAMPAKYQERRQIEHRGGVPLEVSERIVAKRQTTLPSGANGNGNGDTHGGNGSAPSAG